MTVDDYWQEMQPFFEKWENFIAENNYVWALKDYQYWYSRLIEDYPIHTKYNTPVNTKRHDLFPELFNKYLQQQKVQL